MGGETQRSVARVEQDLRRQLATLRGLQVLGTVMITARDPDRILDLARSASITVAPSCGGCTITIATEGAAQQPEPVGGGWSAAYPIDANETPARVLVSAHGSPTDEEQFFLGVLAQQTAVALLNARLQDQERREAVSALRASEDRFRALAETAPDLVYRFALDPPAFEYVSPSVSVMLGYSPDECYRDPSVALRVLHPDDAAALTELVTSGERISRPLVVRTLARDGRTLHLEHRLVALDDASGRRVVQGIARDVTEQVEARRRLELRSAMDAAVAELGQRALLDEHGSFVAEAARTAAVTLGASHAAVFDTAGDNDFVVRSAWGWSDDVRGTEVRPGDGWVPGAIAIARLATVSGPIDERGLGIEEIGHEYDRGGAPSHLAPLLRDEGVLAVISVPLLGRDRPLGSLDVYSLERRTFGLDEVRFVEAVARLLSLAAQRREAEDEIRWHALHDPLTGLPNRALFLDRLDLALARAGRLGSTLAVLFIDLDEFKVVNDSLGHGVGDELLVAVASRLASNLRPNDTVARFGGDEFVVLCEDVDARIATQLAARTGGLFRDDVATAGVELHMAASIGVAVSSPGRTDAGALVRDADTAMYRAKRRGRARWELFDDELRREVVGRLETEAALRRGLDRAEIDIHLQPVIDLRTGALHSAEALVRWRRDGNVPPLLPGAFLPVAEDTGLVVPIGDVVMRAAYRQIHEWRGEGLVGPGFRIGVNLAARQLERGDLPADVVVAADAGGEPPASVLFEITESAAMEDPATTAATLRELRSLGCLIAIDDFGTGWSSLAYLRRFPIDILKIDRSFVAGVPGNAEDRAIVAGVVALAHSLGLLVQAEGVETEHQRDFLTDIGCDLAQGFLWAPAMPAPEFMARAPELARATPGGMRAPDET